MRIIQLIVKYLGLLPYSVTTKTFEKRNYKVLFRDVAYLICYKIFVIAGFTYLQYTSSNHASVQETIITKLLQWATVFSPILTIFTSTISFIVYKKDYFNILLQLASIETSIKRNLKVLKINNNSKYILEIGVIIVYIQYILLEVYYVCEFENYNFYYAITHAYMLLMQLAFDYKIIILTYKIKQKHILVNRALSSLYHSYKETKINNANLHEKLKLCIITLDRLYDIKQNVDQIFSAQILVKLFLSFISLSASYFYMAATTVKIFLGVGIVILWLIDNVAEILLFFALIHISSTEVRN